MFQSYQHISLHQQIITLTQSYPCPRCSSGALEPYGETETFKCNGCSRGFVPLRGGRLLCPAKRMGFKVAPTFWWDGLRWHWAGTTASHRQLALIVCLFFMPLLIINGAMHLNIWSERPDWLSPLLLTAIVGLLNMQLIYLMCWDFDFLVRRKGRI